MNNDSPVRAVPVQGSSCTIEYINPGTYYARLFIDTNSDSIWTTGRIGAFAGSVEPGDSISLSVQPEEVYYFPKKINLRKNWDVEMDWNIYELPVEMQKPQEIKKNKPKRKKEDGTGTTDEEEEDYYDDPLNNPFDTNTNRRTNNSTANPRLRQASGGNAYI